MITFLDSLKEYKNRTGKKTLSKTEVHGLREQYESFVKRHAGRALHESSDWCVTKPSDAEGYEVIKGGLPSYGAAKAWVKRNLGEITYDHVDEFGADAEIHNIEVNGSEEYDIQPGRALHENAKPLNDMKVVIKNYKKVKESKGLGTKVSYKELKTLQEGVAKANRRGIALKEADPNFMANQAAAAQAPAPAAPVDAGIQSQIQDLLQQVQALAQAAGVTVDELGANPEANIGAVNGMADPNAAPAVDAAADPNAPLVEAVKNAYKTCERIDEAAFVKILAKVNKGKERTHLDLVQERVNLRTARMSLQEDACGANDFAKAYLKQLGVSMENFEKHNPGSVDESQLKNMPSEAQLAKGVSTGAAAKETKPANRWPTKPIKTVQLQGEGAKKITESTEKTVTDQYLDNYFAEKLDFSKIKESMSKGLLG